MTNATNNFDALADQILVERHDEPVSASLPTPAASASAIPAQHAALLQTVQVLDPLAADQGNRPMFERLGGIVRLLHDSLRELGYDRSLSHAALQIIDAQDRLEYVATLTEQAANKVLNAIDIGIPEQDRLGKQADAMNRRWVVLFEGKSSFEELRALVDDSRQFSATVAQVTELEKARLLEIMMAQDFQDITGQLIKKIMAIIKAAEMELANLLRDNAPPEIRAAMDAAENHPVNLMQGPSLPATAMEQDGVDDLLGSLGF